jgi:dUTP pyrophosphatase
MFKKLTDDAILPQAQTQYSAGYDVYANEDVIIGAGETKLVPLGIALDELGENLKNYYFGLYLRSSYGAKGLILPNGVGIIDVDYKEEIKQIIHNPIKPHYNGNGEETKEVDVYSEIVIKKGDRVGQLILHKHYGLQFLGKEYRKDETRASGFGSTGEK